MKIANRIFGYLLLLVGLTMIGYSVLNVYQVFKGQILPYNLFSNHGIYLDLSKLVENAPKNASLTQEIISSELLNKPMNLAAHIVLMGFVVSAGFKIASIGTMLIRTIKVKVKKEKEPLPIGSSSLKPTWK